MVVAMLNDILNNLRGIVFSGAGGAIGFLFGVIYYLHSRGIRHNIIAGVSSGAIVGIMYAVGKLDRLLDILIRLEDSQVRKERHFKYARRFAYHLIGIGNPVMGIYDNTPLRELLKRELLGETVKIDFIAISVNAHTSAIKEWHFKKGFTFTHDNIDKSVAKILSSTAIPGVFPPENIDGQYYIDGGSKTHTPIAPIKQVLPDSSFIDIVTTAGHERPEIESIRSDLDFVPGVITDMIGNTFELDRVKFTYRNKSAYFQRILREQEVDLSSYPVEIVKDLLEPDYFYFPSKTYAPSQGLSPSMRFHKRYAIPDIQHGKIQAMRALGIITD